MEKRIKITLHGPYEVFGNVPLKSESIVSNNKQESMDWQTDKELDPPGDVYCLCRCGRSQSRPYCDGTHAKIGFLGEEVADKAPFAQQALRYEGEALDLLDQENLCAVVRFCHVGKSIWKLILTSSDQPDRELAVYEAQHCPSGRLVLYTKDGKALEPPLEKQISLIEDPVIDCKGPLWVKGGITIEGADGELYESRNRVTLCRCGQTSNAPFCDAQHTRYLHMRGMDYCEQKK